MNPQEQCEIYNWHFMITTDYIDHKFITSINHAKNYLLILRIIKERNGEKLFKSVKDLKLHGVIPVV